MTFPLSPAKGAHAVLRSTIGTDGCQPPSSHSARYYRQIADIRKKELSHESTFRVLIRMTVRGYPSSIRGP